MKQLTTLFTASAIAVFSPSAISSDYEISWSKISNGGNLSQTMGGYSITGTIGEYDAGQTGDSMGYSISGGFLPGSESTSSCLADLTDDGVLNFFDVSAFLSAFSSGDAIADFTKDGVFNFFDVSAFLSAFSEGCP